MVRTPPETPSGGFSASDLAAEVSNAQQSIRTRLEEGLYVFGLPAAQGSMRVFYGRIVHNNEAELKAWRQKINDAVVGEPMARPLDLPLYPDAVYCGLLFELPAPKNRKREYPTGHQEKDLDKLVRAVLDALTIARVWSDDSQVVTLEARKVYTSDRPSARITIIPA